LKRFIEKDDGAADEIRVHFVHNAWNIIRVPENKGMQIFQSFVMTAHTNNIKTLTPLINNIKTFTHL
jgi:hypothetical protein